MKKNIYLFTLALCLSIGVNAQNHSAQKAKKKVVNAETTEISTRTGATSKADSETLNHKSTIKTSNDLFGILPGLSTLQNAGTAWENGAKLYLRGMGTLNNKAPLVIVDGFQRSINELVVEEIESIAILKDAIAASLYGIRGGNGVILIKTKRGSVTAPQINFSYTFNVGTPKRLPNFVDGFTYANALNEALVNDGHMPQFNADQLQAYKDQTHPDFYPNVDWVDETLRNATFGDEINFSAKGGSKNVKYYTLLNFQDSRGLLKPTNQNDGYSTQQKYSKLNIRTNLDINVSKNTTVDINFLGNFSEHHRPATTTGDLFNSIFQVPSGAFPIKTKNNIWGGTDIYGNNPVALIAGKGYARSQSRSLYADMGLNQKCDFLLEGLSAGFKVAIDNTASYWDNNSKNFGYESANLDLTTGEETFKILREEGNLSFSKQVGSAMTHKHFNSYLNYHHDWNKHSLNTTLSYNMDKTNVKGRNKSRAFVDIVSQTNYTYANKYLVDLSIGTSASSVLDPDNQWGFFPAIGLGWIVSNENFMQQLSWINYLKLRTSYGILGRADYGLNLYQNIFGGGNGYQFGANNNGFSGQKLSHLGVENLTYEKANNFNFGFDLKAFNGLSLTFDAFYNKRTDILIEGKGAISSALGIEPTMENTGKVNNYGMELALSWDNSIGELQYHIGGNFSFARNEIKNMNEEYKPFDYLYGTGKSLNQIFGYEVIGMYTSQEEIDNSPIKQQLGPVFPGDLIYKDQNGDNIIDSYDRVALGYNGTCPEIYYGFDLSAEYKGLGFYALFQGVTNYSKILNTRSIYRPIVGNNTISEYYYERRWHATENPTGTLPRLTYEGSDNNYCTNSLWVEDASFLKLRTLELYYNLPKKLLRKLPSISNLKLFARGHDLFCIDYIDIRDPEAIGAGHPTMTQYSIGFNLEF